jgi:hypothetical protein
MRTPTNHIAVLLCIAALPALLLLVPRKAFACSCVTPGTAQEELDRSDAVFTGTVTKISKGSLTDYENVNVSLTVDRVWKGSVAKTITIQTSADEPTCGFSFEKDLSYLVYATNIANHMQTSICSRTTMLSAAQSDISALGPSSVPTARTLTSQEYRTIAVSVLIGCAAFILALMGMRARKTTTDLT